MGSTFGRRCDVISLGRVSPVKRDNFSRRKVLQHLERARQLVAQTPSIKKYRRIEDLVAALRKTREEIWEEKLVARPR